ncbi:FkbM family methyltransferase [Hellea balneolensis]|uniref:FkbM family methyltransferase n=1 Tax=Hellea balneolensis TaxID=287478 RepID=UPI0003FD8FCA|nr:FkbM family methyltransferase [Hellea balneolensis]
MTYHITPPFGTYALPPAREAWRKKADGYGDTRIGRALISRARKKALAGETGPFDIQIEDGISARLYPSGNRCEKRAFAGVQVWDLNERLALKSEIENHSDVPFVFLDVGANVGLYSLYVNAYAAQANRAAQIIAIEPGVQTCARLEANIAVNDANIQIIRAAVSDAPGTGYLGGGDVNRGEAKLSAQSDTTETVVVDTLPRIARTLGLTRLDAMKVDIEGHDLKALTTFFEDASSKLHPKLLILETGRAANSPLIELCEANDYVVTERTKMNTILKKASPKEALEAVEKNHV